MTKAGVLYLVPTPIGNLGDITLRAIDTLKSVKMIAAEDTRQTGILLKHYQISKTDLKLISYHKFNEKSRVKQILDLLQSGGDVAIVSDAGSPGISDPSGIIVQAAISAGIDVIALPGATAFVPVLTASGLDCSSFTFYGFLPVKKSAREALLREIQFSPRCSVLYQSCPKLYATLKEIYAICGNRDIVIGREISKIYEEYTRRDLSTLIEEELTNPLTLKGEIVILISAAIVEVTAIAADSLDDVIREKLRAREKVATILDYLLQVHKLNKNAAYNRILALKKEMNTDESISTL